MPAVSSAPDFGSGCFGKSVAQQVLQADTVPVPLKSNVRRHRFLFSFHFGKFGYSRGFGLGVIKTSDFQASLSASVVSVIPELAVVLGHT